LEFGDLLDHPLGAAFRAAFGPAIGPVCVAAAIFLANPEFMRLTGYGSLEALREVGGIEDLLQRRDLEENAAGSGTMMLVKADDTMAQVTARLQSVRWED
ncbi:hypothetical protein ACC713_36290, partial [Rhizobium johnstonii]|uniref:hypothetical protein n=1 Tax=Rhizobium johnstonii TaxID=3019933 RepID=UPI003F9734C0